MQINSDRRFGVVILLLLSLIVVATVSHRSLAAERCTHAAARLVSLFGTVEHRPQNSKIWQSAQLDAIICPGDFVRTGARSRAAVIFFDTETVLRIDQNTTLRVRTPRKPGRTLLDLLKGAAQFFSRTPRALEVDTPFVNAAIEGTEFFLAVGADQTALTVFEGKVNARNQSGQLIATDGQSLIAKQGAAPRAITVVRPRDAVQWALYYPPVLSGPDVTGSTKATREAAALLAAGRVNEAAAKLRTAGDAAPALALRAVIAVAQNDKAAALSRGRAAVAADPNSGAARIALSYALQASFDIVGARNVMQDAVARRPGDALAWARLAELDLSLGARDDAVEAAAKAAEISPDISRMNTVLGFAALARFHTGEARSAFERAIREDSQDPLPRLGLGLAKIRDGDLAEGRREIEIATALDPGSSINRSYMGKAYFEENREKLAGKEFDIAKSLDSKDPTPWFYDAIRKQTENRPVDALEDIERSIALNDNRAVYRSRLLLDEDLAVRSTSLGRIYQDLGFERLAEVEGGRSLTHDPANYSAHRFLADSYALKKRHEIARVSEQLQAQLLQPLNNEPVQPKLNPADLTIVPGIGPAEAAFNEFSSLFARDQVRFTGTGLIGSNNTRGDEAVISGIVDRFSYSVGQYHFEDDGFRANNDQEHNIYNAFAQAALTDQLNVQAEVRRRRTDEGDLRLDFDPNDFSTTDRRAVNQRSVRFGAHYAPRPGVDLIGSFIYSKHKEGLHIVTTGPIIDRNFDIDAYDGQMQGLFRGDRWSLIAGGGVSDSSDDSSRISDFTSFIIPPPIGPICPFPFPNCINTETTEINVKQRNVYGYLNINYPETVTWTFGLSYDSFDNGIFDTGKVNPKFGVQWDISDRLRLRGTAFRMLKRQLVVDQTLEPTAIAGFNQFFDDTNGTVVDAYGIGLDAKIMRRLYGGIEASKRELQVPVLDFFAGTITDIEDQDEERASAYLYWALDSNWALRTEAELERFKRRGTGGGNLPTEVKTLSVPLAVRYFNPSGLFGELSVSYVNQKVGLPATSTFNRDHDDFFVVDTALGFRFPKRRGVLSLEVRNLFDKHFLFQDSNLQSSEPSTPRFIPERTIVARFTLAL